MRGAGRRVVGPGGRGFESRRSPLVKSLVSADAAGNRTGRSSTTGTDAHASTSGNAIEEGGDEPPIRFRGDELDLSAEFHFAVVMKVQRAVVTPPEVVADACSYAWVEFLKHQPERRVAGADGSFAWRSARRGG